MSTGNPYMDSAHAAKNATQAQRLRKKWTEQIEDPDADGNVRELQQAIDFLEAKYGDKLPANPIANMRSGLGDKRRSSEKMRPEQVADARRAAPRQRRSQGGRRRSGGSGARFLPSGSLLEQTGIPGASRGAAGAVLQLVGMTVGLALLYLFLTDAERAGRGRSAVEGVWGFISGGVSRIIDPIDPIPGGRAKVAATAATMDIGGGQLPTSPRPIAPSRQAYHAARHRANARKPVNRSGRRR